MFDVSFAEVLVLVTGAGLLLGRREILQGSRVAGKMLGRGVGVLQGVRIRYEEKTRGSRVHQMPGPRWVGYQSRCAKPAAAISLSKAV